MSKHRRIQTCVCAAVMFFANTATNATHAQPHVSNLASVANLNRPEIPIVPKATPTPTATRVAPVRPTASATPTLVPTPSPTPTTTPSPSSTTTPQPSPNPSPSVLFPPAPPISQYAFGALKYVRKQVGKRYVVGGNGPDVFDCSGLMQQAWKAVGVYLPRVSGDQYFATVRIQYSDLQPGDMVFFGPNGSRHVGMYIGDDKMIDAANPRAGIKISDLTQNWYRTNLAGYGRVEADDF